MAPLQPAEGERNAIVGYDGQYRVSASLILDGLLNAQLDWVRIADPEAGRVDDLQIGSQGRVDAYQVKWSQFPQLFSFNELVGGKGSSGGLIAQLAQGWTTLKHKNPNKRIVVHLITSNLPSTHAQVPLGERRPTPSHFAAFIEQVWRPAHQSSPDAHFDIPSVWLPAWRALCKASGLGANEFQEFVRDCVLEFGYQVDQRSHLLLSSEDQLARSDIDEVELMLIQSVADPARIIELNREDILQRLNWTGRFTFRNRHSFPVDENIYQDIEATRKELFSALSSLRGGYIAILGSPGSGKSTVLTKTLKSIDARVISYYAYVPDSHSPTTLRGESVNFLHDVVLQLNNSGFHSEQGSTRPDRNQLLERLHHQMDLLNKDWIGSGRKTVVLIDGLDHIEREQHPNRSLLLDLPDPDRVPEGVYFVLGTQTDNILPPRIQAVVRKPGNKIDMRPLERQQVSAIIEATELKNKLTEEQERQVFQLSAGHPLYLVYIINKLTQIDDPAGLDEELKIIAPFESNIEGTYQSYWEQFSDDDELRRLLGLLSRMRGVIDLSWVRTWAATNVVDRLGRQFAHYFRIEDNSRWRFFHNSFRLFLVEKTAEFPPGNSDLSRHRDFHLELAGLFSSQPAGTPLAWEEIYHWASGGQFDKVLEIATQEYFRDQFLALRPIDAINADILVAFRAAAESQDHVAISRLSMIASELSQRDFYLDESDILSILWKLGKHALVLSRLIDGSRLLVSEETGLQVSRLLKLEGYDVDAQRAFELGEPISLLHGPESAVTEDSLSLVESWARAAVLFTDIENIIETVRVIKHDDRTRVSENSEALSSELQAHLLAQTGIQLMEDDRWDDLSTLINAFSKSTRIEMVARVRLILRVVKTCRATGDFERATDYLNTLTDDDRNLLRSEDITSLAEAIYRCCDDAEQARDLLRDVEQPALRSDLGGFNYGLAPFTQRFTLNRLLYALDEGSHPSDVVPDAENRWDKGIVVLERALCTIARLWAKAWIGQVMDARTIKGEVLPLLRLAIRSEEDPDGWRTWHPFKESRVEFYSLLVTAVEQHGNDALLGLAELFEHEWNDLRTRRAWPADEQRNVILSFSRTGFRRSWAIEKLRELDGLVVGASGVADVDERVNQYLRQANAWLELQNGDRANHFLKIAIEQGFGIGYRKDYQLNRWIRWLGRINDIQPGDAPRRIRKFVHAVEILDLSTEGRAAVVAAEELLRVTFRWSPIAASELLVWLLENGLIGYRIGVRILLEEALKSNRCPIKTVMWVFVELLLPFDTDGDPDLVKSILGRVADDEGVQDTLEAAKILATKIRTLSSPPARDAWLQGLVSAVEELGSSTQKLDIYVEDVKFAQEDKRLQDSLRLKGMANEISLESVRKLVSSITDVRRLIDKEDRSSYFDWSPVVERLIMEIVEEGPLCEIAELFKDQHNHSSEVLTAISRRLNEIGEFRRAWDCGVEALERSSGFGWDPWYDGGVKYGAIRALSQIDRTKTITLTYQQLAKDLESNSALFSAVVAGLDEILELVASPLDISAVWAEVEEHSTFLLPESDPTGLSELLKQRGGDTSQRALLTFLMECMDHPIPALCHGSQRAVGNLLMDRSPELKSVLKNYLKRSERYQERILVLLDVVGLIDPSSVSQFQGEIRTLTSSPNWDIRLVTRAITETQGWNIPAKSNDLKQLLWAHNLTIPSESLSIPSLSFSPPSGRPPVQSDDISTAVGLIFDREISFLSETADIPAEHIHRRIVSLSYELASDASVFSSSAEQRLRETLGSVGLNMHHLRPRSRIIRRAFSHTVAELEDAGRINSRDSQTLESISRTYDPALNMEAPTQKPRGIPPLDEFSFRTDRKKWVADVKDALQRTFWKPSEDLVVIAEKTILTKQGEWEFPTETHYSQLELVNAVDLLSKPSFEDFFSSTRMSTVSSYPAARRTPAGSPLVMLNEPRSIDSPGVDWLAFNPRIAKEIGWSLASDGRFKWVDSGGCTMVESIWWTNGLPNLHSVGSQSEEASEGWVVVATQEAYSVLMNNLGPMFKMSLVSREIREEGKRIMRSAFQRQLIQEA